MSSVQSEIIEWARSIPYWEQFALRKIMHGAVLQEQDYRQMLQYLLEDAGLVRMTDDHPNLRFEDIQSEEAPIRAPVQLVAIHNLENINALVPNQRLEFGPQLTAIFGANGSGKSGYARVLGSAAFTRGDKEVLPNVMEPVDDGLTQCATVTVRVGAEERSISYEVGTGCPDLAGFYMFDSTAVAVHMSKENAISFTPAGLTALQRLATATDRVRELLEEEITRRGQHCDFSCHFEGNSAVREVILALDSQTDMEELKALANVSAAETDRIPELEREIAKLRLQDVPGAISNLEETKSDLNNLLGRLEKAEAVLADSELKSLADLLEECNRWQSGVRQLGSDKFASAEASYIGSDPWFEFIQAAKSLAALAGTETGLYPQAGGRCLLCQQELSDEALELINRFWQFLDDALQQSLKNAEAALQAKRQNLQELQLDFFEPQAVWYRYLSKDYEMLVDQIGHFLDECHRRRRAALAARDRSEIPSDVKLPSSMVDGVKKIIEETENRIAQLEDSEPAQEIEALEAELRLLRHRVVLSQHIESITEYVENQRWVDKARQAGGSTRHITVKYNAIFDGLVTRRYLELFRETLEVLGRSLQVEVKTRGRKGDVIKQVVVKADESVPARITSPERILSEGEKRAVALADFLTEVALDSSSCGVILDDPVSSLDLDWRNVIAEMLAQEAQRQQIIVFTHDLPFLYFLNEESEQKGVSIRTHWIKRGDTDGRPGYVFVDNSPAMEKDYKTSHHAQRYLQEARNAPPEEQEGLLRAGFGALRTSYEALIIFEMFKGVVQRWGERISFGRLEDVAWDRELARDVVRSCERLSRHIEGHLHSDAYIASKPTPVMLQEEIQHFDKLRKRIRQLSNLTMERVLERGPIS